MRQAVISILLVLAVLAGGCTGPFAMVADQDPTNTSGPGLSGGMAIAIAVNADEIATTSSEAKDLFLRGLTASTQYARYDESLPYFDAALAIDRNFTEAYYAKGVALHNLKRYDEAVTWYERALVLDPQNAAVWDLKAAALEDAGRLAEAAECYRKAAEIDPRYGAGFDKYRKIVPAP